MSNKKENPFKQLETEVELPEGLRKKVMNSIGYAQMLTGFAELFTVNMAETAAGLTEADIVGPDEEIKKKSDQSKDMES